MPRRAWASVSAAASAISLLLAPIGVRADQPATTVHVVQPGETLSQIADDAGIDTAALASLNGLDDPNVLTAGQSLKLPAGATLSAPSASAAAALAAPAPASRTYMVSDGDTLWAIAHQFGTTTDALVQLNNLDSADHLVSGAVLTLPGVAPATSPTAAPAPRASTSPPARSVSVSYTVQSGETLSQIAHQFEVTAADIAQASGLDDPNKLSVGAVLKVPVPAREHVVTDGETLRDIAAAEKVDLGSLLDFNPQVDNPALIRVGQVLVLPLPATIQAATIAPQPQSQTAAAATVKPTPTPTPAQPKPVLTPPPPAAKPAAAEPAAKAAPPGTGAKPAPAPKATPTAAPLAVVKPPAGAPTDGLAGAGLKLLGAPYVWGGSDPGGFDCSGFVWYVAGQLGKQLSRGMLGQYNSGSHPGRADLKPGDLVFFQNTFAPGLSHNGIYIGGNQFVHAADEAAGVTISSLDTPYWSTHWFGATHLP